jgi:hypothetical protein
MIAIAAIAVTMASMVLSPYVFIAVLFVFLESVAVIRFRESRRRKPMSGGVQILWVFAFLILIPIVSVVVALTALYAYCSVNPDAYQ